MDEMLEPRHLSSILTCHADIPSAPTLMTDCQGRFGALVSPALDCGEEFVCTTQMYGDSGPVSDITCRETSVCTALLYLF